MTLDETKRPTLKFTRLEQWRFAFFALIFPGLALAYIDPGTGAYVAQGLIALFGTVAFYVTHPRQLIKRVWTRMFKSGSESQEARIFKGGSSSDME